MDTRSYRTVAQFSRPRGVGLLLTYSVRDSGDKMGYASYDKVPMLASGALPGCLEIPAGCYEAQTDGAMRKLLQG
jgi:hypothetical protein